MKKLIILVLSVYVATSCTTEKIKEQSQLDTPSSKTKIKRYKIIGGVVKDTKTNLTWLRCSLGQNWNGKTCVGKIKKVPWKVAINEANNYIGENHNDWRLPTINELRSIVYCDNGLPQTWKTTLQGCQGKYGRPIIHKKAFPKTGIHNWYWSSTSSPGSDKERFAKGVHFYYGYSGGYLKSYSYHVRLVRTGF